MADTTAQSMLAATDAVGNGSSRQATAEIIHRHPWHHRCLELPPSCPGEHLSFRPAQQAAASGLGRPDGARYRGQAAAPQPYESLTIHGNCPALQLLYGRSVLAPAQVEQFAHVKRWQRRLGTETRQQNEARQSNIRPAHTRQHGAQPRV